MQSHVHENNPTPPSDDPTLMLLRPDGLRQIFTLTDLHALPQSVIPAHTFITDHGPHGPYCLQGVALRDVIAGAWSDAWEEVAVISADAYSARIGRQEVEAAGRDALPILLCYASDGQPLTRAQGLVRLVVPSETDNALRQIKWVQRLILHERLPPIAPEPLASHPQLCPPT